MDDPQTLSTLRIILAFTVVTTLLAGLGLGLKWLQKRGFGTVLGINARTHNTQPRVSIRESHALDIHRRLVIVQWDEGEHLLLLGKEGDVVIASKPAPDSSPQPISSSPPMAGQNP
jgi:hypothetical protein